jgi:hypothetical protein
MDENGTDGSFPQLFRCGTLRSLCHLRTTRTRGTPLYLLAPLLQRCRQVHARAGVGGDFPRPVAITRHADADGVLPRLQLQRGRTVAVELAVHVNVGAIRIRGHAHGS